jgi:glycosyltransferase involved in cell wall biosynthesis
MRIIHLLNHTNRLNGHVHAAVDLACEQSRQGHTVCVASGGGDFDALLRSNGVSTAVIDHRRRPLQLLRSMYELRKLARSFRPDVIHAHMMTSAVLTWVGCRFLPVKLVTTVHNEFEKSAILMGLGDRVIAVSAAVKTSMHKRGIPASKLSVVLNGTIGSARLAHRATTQVDMVSPSILFVGGLHPRKGLPDLFEAFEIVHQAVAPVELYIVGEGPYGQSYQELVSRMACAPAVTFLGAKADPYPWMVGADIFVLPSHADPAPLVLSEAREARCAVVASNVDGIPELLERGEAGILVPPHNARELADVLINLLQHPALIEEWKARSQFRIEHLTIQRVVEETLAVYTSVLSDRKMKTSPVHQA